MRTKFTPVALVFAIILLFAISCKLPSFTKSDSNSGGSGGGSKPASPDTSGTGAPGICQNAYYPVGPNVERKYHIKYGQNSALDQDYSESYANFEGDKFTSRMEFKGLTTNMNWRCVAEGLLATEYGNSMDMKKSGMSVKFDTLNSKGVSFPSEANWKTGEKWNTAYEVKENISGADGKQMVTADGSVNQAAEIVGEESVTVPAGTFQTFKVNIKTSMDLKMQMHGANIPVKSDLLTTVWFAKDVGMVKSESIMSGISTATTELLSYKK